MKESDRTIFKETKNKAIEKNCIYALNDFHKAMDNEGLNIQEKYFLNYKLVKNVTNK